MILICAASLNAQNDSIKFNGDEFTPPSYNYGIVSKTNSVESELRLTPYPTAKTIQIIPPNSSIIIITRKNGYWFIDYNGKLGFINEIWIVETRELKLLAIQEDTKWNDSINKVNEKIKRIQKVYNDSIDKIKSDSIDKSWNEFLTKQKIDRQNRIIKKYGKVNGNKILNHYFWIGMTKDMAIESLGQPSDINKSVGSWGVHEQWVYGEEYLYFENGILTSYQN